MFNMHNVKRVVVRVTVNCASIPIPSGNFEIILKPTSLFKVLTNASSTLNLVNKRRTFAIQYLLVTNFYGLSLRLGNYVGQRPFQKYYYIRSYKNVLNKKDCFSSSFLYCGNFLKVSAISTKNKSANNNNNNRFSTKLIFLSSMLGNIDIS